MRVAAFERTMKFGLYHIHDGDSKGKDPWCERFMGLALCHVGD